MVTTNNMKFSINTILDMLAACDMQLSIWQWEIQMIANYGFDWGYREPWDRF
jgi:hypothetical protein